MDLFDEQNNTHPCPYLFNDGTNILLSEDLKIYCNQNDVTHEIVNLRKKDGARYDDVIDIAVEVIGYDAKHKNAVARVLKKLRSNYCKKNDC